MDSNAEELINVWWFCLRHMRVESKDGCAHAERLGPYETEAEAGEALHRAKERTVEEDERDHNWGDFPGI